MGTNPDADEEERTPPPQPFLPTYRDAPSRNFEKRADEPFEESEGRGRRGREHDGGER
jgi:hypothetical protein